jgi:hypothetical protein
VYSNKCKICRSGKADEIEFCRFYLKWSYSLILDVYEDDIDNLNSYNLSNHFNNHVNRAKAKFWGNLRESEGIYDPSIEKSNVSEALKN